MKYRVVFRERSNEAGEKAEDPSAFLNTQLDDETVIDATFVSRAEPDALHSSDRIEEDDGFLARSTTEIWEYDVAEGKDDDFIAALQNSGMVIEFEPLESDDELGVS
ncbi:MAG TPA: hypothetical protein VH302_14945 [Bryobacteraceae bacterium]|jgi:hypothetical protein|nr:hypothetical protein [Bryobacteraceae bacterium]